MIRALIIDDEEQSRKLLISLLSFLPIKTEIVAEAEDVDTGIAAIKKHEPELVFLDIHLKNGLGFDILNQFINPFFQVIFTTAHDSYAIKAFRFSALDYLLKPVNPEELLEALKKTIQNRTSSEELNGKLQILDFNKKNKNKKLALTNSEGIHFVDIHDIIFCKGEGSYTTFFLTNNRNILISKGIKEYDDLLNPYGFFRTHQSYIINLAQVNKLLKEDGGTLLMNNGSKICVSRRKKEKLLEILLHT